MEWLDRMIVVAKGEHIFSDLEDEAVILHVPSGVCYGLNAVGKRVWRLIQCPLSASQIRDTLLAEYDVESEICESGLLTLFDEMSARGLIEVTIDASS